MAGNDNGNDNGSGVGLGLGLGLGPTAFDISCPQCRTPPIIESSIKLKRAPSQSDWETLTSAEQDQVIEQLSSSLETHEAASPEGDAHLYAKLGALDALSGYFSKIRGDVYVGCELVVYYPDAPRFAPDIFVVFGVDPHRREKWVVSAEGKGLDFVLEVHYGGDRAKDAVRNVALYASLGIPEYFIYDRRSGRLLGHRLPDVKANQYVPVLPQRGRYASRALGLDLVLESDRLRFFTANAPILESREWTDRLEVAVDDLSKRVEEEAHARQKEAHARQEEAHARQEEVQRRIAAEQRVAELEAQLEALRKAP